MTEAALRSDNTKASEEYDKSDWASAYRNVEEELTKVELKVKSGSVPKELNGTLYRNGPGKLERNGQWVHHPFDGDGMIVSLQFQNGMVNLSNRFIRTQAWKEEEKAGKFIYRGVFGTQKKGGLIANAFDVRLKNIANTHVIQLGEELLALWEASSPHALNPNTLETYGISTLNGVLQEDEAFSAHPRFDPGHYGDPRMVTFGVKTGPKSTIRLMEFEATGINSGSLISDKKETFNGFAFLHDFAITPNWAIFLQNSIAFNPLPFVFGQKGAAQCLTSNHKEKGKFLLIPRESGVFSGESPRVFDAPKGFVFHHLNAWENKNELVIESIFYDDFPSVKPEEDFREINFDLFPEGQLKRTRINFENNQVKSELLSTQCCEFAMVNPKKLGKSAQYTWMATAEKTNGNGPLQAIKKLDLSNRENYRWSAAPRGFVNEPIMVPNKSSSKEDDGWVLVVIWNGKRQSNDLIILKADNLSEQAVVELPIAIPYGLHGSWVDSLGY